MNRLAFALNAVSYSLFYFAVLTAFTLLCGCVILGFLFLASRTASIAALPWEFKTVALLGLAAISIHRGCIKARQWTRTDSPFRHSHTSPLP